jgi:DNA-binding SARP family transcriptional activator
VDFRILGPVEVRAAGRPLVVAGGRQRALLAVLLLRAGEPVSRERVIADLWGERPPAGAVKTVQAVVSRLRRALGGEAARLVSGAAGYRLRVERDELDLGRFERLCEDGRRALAAGRHERAAARFRAALEEWRGPPLADVALEPFAPPEIAHLEDLRAAAVEDRVEADLAAGRGAELVGELEALVAQEPLRERLRGQLMLALYRAGRQGEALDAYREAVRTLEAELGLHPGPELERLQHAILNHDPALLRGPPSEAPSEVERRRATSTILFADLAGSARMREWLGDDDADVVRALHARVLSDVLAAHGAIGVKTLGDGLLAAFAAAGAALACAVEMQRAIDRQARRGPVALELRIGVGAGDVAWAGDDFSGTPVIEAQRLCAAASSAASLSAMPCACSRAPAPRPSTSTRASWRFAISCSRCARGRSAGRPSARSPCPSPLHSSSMVAPRSPDARTSSPPWRLRGPTPPGGAAAGCSSAASRESARPAWRPRWQPTRASETAWSYTAVATTALPPPRSHLRRRSARMPPRARSTSCASS